MNIDKEIQRIKTEVGETQYTLQLDLTARLLKLLDALQSHMDARGFKYIRTVAGANGDREEPHPLLTVYLSTVSKTQSAIKALGRNCDSKVIKEEKEDSELMQLLESMGKEAW